MVGEIIIKEMFMPYEIATITIELILLSGCLLILVTGSGKISVSQYIPKLPEIMK